MPTWSQQSANIVGPREWGLEEGKGRRKCFGDRIDSINCCAIAVLHQDDFNKMMNSSYLQIDLVKISSVARN